jgi:anti-sigma factor RsiW
MNCSDFLTSFTDYLDGRVSAPVAEEIEGHLRVCDSCIRYRRVVEEGATLLSSLPAPELHEDFEPRLRHRLYHVDDERVLSAHQSGASAMTVLGIAILLTALAWAPMLRGGGPDVRLEPIVVDRAPRRASPFRPALLAPPGTFSTKTPSELDDGLWDNTLLYEYSALSQRYNQRMRARRVADFDR